MAQLRKTIDIIENAINELIDNWDNMAYGNEELFNYTLNDLEDLKKSLELSARTGWYDSIGQSLSD